MNNFSKIVQGPPRPRHDQGPAEYIPGRVQGQDGEVMADAYRRANWAPQPVNTAQNTQQSWSLPPPVNYSGQAFTYNSPAPPQPPPSAYYTPPPVQNTYAFPPPTHPNSQHMFPAPPPAPVIGSLAEKDHASHNTMPPDNQSNMIPIMTRQSQYEYPQQPRIDEQSLLDEMIVPKEGRNNRTPDSRSGTGTPVRSLDPRLKAAIPGPSISSTRNTELELEEPPPPQVSRLQATVPRLRMAVDKMVREEKGIILGLRKDLYEPQGRSTQSPASVSYSYHQPVDTPFQQESFPDNINIQEDIPSSTVMLEEKFSDDVDGVSNQSKLPDSTVIDLGDTKNSKEEGKVLDGQPSTGRCNLCPSPGIVSLGMKMEHQASHVTACFSCAACSGRRRFEEFDELVRHINSVHGVTDSEMVMETIILPEVEGGLRMFKCGVTNCGKIFTAQAEIVLRSHMEHRHGAYYIKVGKGKYILRFCRICGEERNFSSEADLDSHIEESHPRDQFGEHLDLDSDSENLLSIKQDPDGEDLTANLMGNLITPRVGLTVQSSSAVEQPSGSKATESLLNSGMRQPSVEDGEIESSPQKSPVKSRSPSPSTSVVTPTKSSKLKKKRRKSRSSSSDSSSSSNSVDVKKKKKLKKYLKSKKSKLSKQEKKFKERVGAFSPEELRIFLKEMKDKKKKLKEKNRKKILRRNGSPSPSPSPPEVTPLPEPRLPFPSIVNHSPSHFYCLICSKYSGKLEDWLGHRATKQHVDLYNTTKSKALKKFNCGDIDMQECVISDKKFSRIPEGQCRECLDIFWGEGDHGIHLKDGRCLKLLEQEKKKQKPLKTLSNEKNRRNSASPSSSKSDNSKERRKSGSSYSRPKVVPETPSRSPSPQIKWKPLPKQVGKNEKWKPISEETRTVFEKSPSPDVSLGSLFQAEDVNSPKSRFPKFMLDGKTAYYICKLCKDSVGNVMVWLEHKSEKSHQAAYAKAGLTEKMDEVIIAGSASVLHKFGDACNKCLVCKVNFRTNAELYRHEQLESHKVALKKAEEIDRKEIRSYGGRLADLFYCELCLVTCELPSDHQQSEYHCKRLKETAQCKYCPKRLDPSSITLHEDAFHPDTGFQCKQCPRKFSSGDSLLLQHASQHLRRRVGSIEELLDMQMFTMPDDLRRMSCNSCKDGVFLGQDSEVVINHILTYHPHVQLRDVNTAVEFSCQLCMQIFCDEMKLTEHIFNKHTNRLAIKHLPIMQVKNEVPVTVARKREFKEVKEVSNISDKDIRKPQFRDRDIRVKNEYKRSPRHGIHQSQSPRRSNSRSPPPTNLRSRSRSSSRRLYSRSRSPRPYRSRSPPFRRYSRRSPQRRYHSRSRSRSPGSYIYRSRSPARRKSRSDTGRNSPPRSTWSRQSLHSEGKHGSPRRTVKRRNSRSLSRSRSRNSSPERKQKEIKLLNSLKKNLRTKKIDMEHDLRAKLASKKVKMLDSRPEGVKLEKVLGEAVNRVCPFCTTKFSSDDDVLHHMKLVHQEDMFRCIKCATSLQPTIGWSVEVLLQHLATQHKLNVSISEAMFNYVTFPKNLHQINCKLCPPPYILGTEGFWVGTDLHHSIESIENHFEQVHIITDKSQVVSNLELACRGCDATFTHSCRLEWGQHVKKDHENMNRPNRSTGPRKRCDYCGEKIVQTENKRHIKETHMLETFQCKPCLEVDPTCFPYFDTIKEMMQHMVMKHGDQFDSYYDHMVYPVTMYGSLCSGSDCAVKGKVMAFDAATIGKHLRVHQDAGGDEVGLFFCRACDRIKEKFKTIEEVKEHISKKHKAVMKWKEANGNN